MSDDAWRTAMVVAQKCSSFLSIFGSSFILQEVVRSPPKRSKVVFRLLASMSASDIMCSIWFFVGTWAVPKGTPGIPSARGDETTCQIQAFVMYAALTTLNFNACLALHYLLTIRFGWSEQQMRKYVEPCCYVYAVGVGVAVGIVPMILDLFAPSNFWCSVKPAPKGPNKYIWLLFYVPAWFTVAFVTVSMIMIYIHVHSTERKAQRHDFASQCSSSQNDDDAYSLSSKSSINSLRSLQERIRNSWRKRPDTKQTNKVATQAFWYCLVFYLTLLFATWTRAMQMAVGHVPKAIPFLFMVFYPLQGFMNFLVYMRPRWMAARAAKRKARQQQAAQEPQEQDAEDPAQEQCAEDPACARDFAWKNSMILLQKLQKESLAQKLQKESQPDLNSRARLSILSRLSITQGSSGLISLREENDLEANVAVPQEEASTDDTEAELRSGKVPWPSLPGALDSAAKDPTRHVHLEANIAVPQEEALTDDEEEELEQTA